jgi:hypothetical protein
VVSGEGIGPVEERGNSVGVRMGGAPDSKSVVALSRAPGRALAAGEACGAAVLLPVTMSRVEQGGRMTGGPARLAGAWAAAVVEISSWLSSSESARRIGGGSSIMMSSVWSWCPGARTRGAKSSGVRVGVVVAEAAAKSSEGAKAEADVVKSRRARCSGREVISPRGGCMDRVPAGSGGGVWSVLLAAVGEQVDGACSPWSSSSESTRRICGKCSRWVSSSVRSCWRRSGAGAAGSASSGAGAEAGTLEP